MVGESHHLSMIHSKQIFVGKINAGKISGGQEKGKFGKKYWDVDKSFGELVHLKR